MALNDPSKPIAALTVKPLIIDQNTRVKVYGSTLEFTRDKRVIWLLNELGIPYELVLFDLYDSEQANPDYLRLHPGALVPALQVGEFSMVESVAILTVLADRFMEHGLAPPLDHVERPAYIQWMHYSASTLDAVAGRIMFAVPRGLFPNPEELEAQLELFDRLVILPEKVLEEREYLLDFGFSAADIALGQILYPINFIGLLEQYPILKRYYDRLAERPAFQASFIGDSYY